MIEEVGPCHHKVFAMDQLQQLTAGVATLSLEDVCASSLYL